MDSICGLNVAQNDKKYAKNDPKEVNQEFPGIVVTKGCVYLSVVVIGNMAQLVISAGNLRSNMVQDLCGNS